jgi:hypothetical protein
MIDILTLVNRSGKKFLQWLTFALTGGAIFGSASR